VVKAFLMAFLLADSQFAFAHSLFLQKEYFRSIGEYQRWLYFHQEDPKAAQANFFIGRAYQEGDRHFEAVRYLRLAEPLGRIAKLRLADSLLRLGSPEGEKILLEMPGEPRADLLLSKKKKVFLEHSPLLAGVSSALIPGLGQLYDGRPGDAAFSFLTVSSLALSAWGAWNNPTLGVSLGGLAAWLYAGNVYGAAEAAQKNNQKAQEETLQAIDRRFGELCPDP
jgi:hypothetical protein